MEKYTKIGQYRNTIQSVREHTDWMGKDENGDDVYVHSSPYPVITFRGTVKLNGTNSSIVKYRDGTFEFQSKESVLSFKDDNHGFFAGMQDKDYQRLFDGLQFNDRCVIYGEWCGDNIQKGTAINRLPRMFVIFAIRVDGKYVDMDGYRDVKLPAESVYNIMDFQTWKVDIDFNCPEASSEFLTSTLETVVDQCPVAATFGAKGPGEGIVWESINSRDRYVFKIKAKNHQSSHMKNTVSTNVDEVNGINEFVEYAVTNNRLLQGIDMLRESGRPIDESFTGDYLRWVYNDIVKEESDTIVSNKIDPKKVGKAISNRARDFWFNYINQSNGIT